MDEGIGLADVGQIEERQAIMSRAQSVRTAMWILLMTCGTAIGANHPVEVDLVRMAQRWLRDAPTVAGEDDLVLPEVMGLVMDSGGRPLSCVLVGEDDLTDLNGVYGGSGARSPAGWIQLDAWGYTTGYVKPDASDGGVDLFLAWMTPFQTLGKVESDKSVELIADANEGIVLTAGVAAEDLSETPAYVGLADVNVWDVGPLSAPLQPAEDLYLIRAFALQAFDATGQAVPSADGRTFTVRIQGVQTPAMPKLAWFDPNAGEWIVVEGACEVTDNSGITCTLPKLWPLYGLFVPGQSPYLPDLDSLGSPTAHSPAQGLRIAGDEVPDPFKSLHGSLHQYMKYLEQNGLLGSESFECGKDPIIRKILEQMAQIARDQAARERNEKAKMHLLWVAERACLLCEPDIESSLMDLAVEITNEIGRRLLNEGDCGRLREMMRAVEQVQAFGGDPAVEQGLRDKIARLLAECDEWIGTIRYAYPISQSLPLTLTGTDYVRRSGASMWMEMHEVRMSTHAETHVLMGQIQTRLSFPSVRYVERAPVPMYAGCPHFHDIRVAQDDPSEQDKINWFYFDGTYDGYTFQVNQPVPAPDAKPVRIEHQHWSSSLDGDGTCNRYPYIVTIIPDEFYSALIHSFMYTLMSPSITLQEMLETGEHNDFGAYETIRGSEPIANPMPMPNHGLYPFTEGEVIWNLIHVHRLLPFEF